MRIELDEKGNFVFVETGAGGGDFFSTTVEAWEDYKGSDPLSEIRAFRLREAKFFALATLGDMGGLWLSADYAASERAIALIAGAKFSGIVVDDVFRGWDLAAAEQRPTWAGRLGRISLWKALERKAMPELVAEEPRSILPLDASRDRHRLGPTSTAAPRQRPPHRRGRWPGPARRRNTRRQ